MGKDAEAAASYGGDFCEQHLYEEVTNATAWNVGIYNVTLRSFVLAGTVGPGNMGQIGRAHV